MEMREDLGEWAVAEVLYESSLKHYGVPVELRMFDPQFSENLNEAWLAQVSEQYGISLTEIEEWARDGLLKKWPGPNGGTNFTLYSEKQVQILKVLLANPRLSKEEVAHIADEWNSYLEMAGKSQRTMTRTSASTSTSGGAPTKWSRCSGGKRSTAMPKGMLSVGRGWRKSRTNSARISRSGN